MNIYEKALKTDREIVVVAADDSYNSAVFWLDSSGVPWSFSRAFGCLRRDDMTVPAIVAHIENMESENAHIFIRGDES